MGGFFILKTKIMETNILPFQLGMEYENWEFDLEPIGDRIEGFDSYAYIHSFPLPGAKIRSIELTFQFDVLIVVILEFEELNLEIAERLIQIGYQKINHYFYLSISKFNILIFHSLLA